MKCITSAYITEVEKALSYIRDSPVLSGEEKRRFFKTANMNLGISALCLSGGATFGYCKLTVYKGTLLEFIISVQIISESSRHSLMPTYSRE